jgi:hypothetical protein
MDIYLPSRESVDLHIKVAALMRTIDAYAFDYAKDGKLGQSRIQVERELREVLRPLIVPKLDLSSPTGQEATNG